MYVVRERRVEEGGDDELRRLAVPAEDLRPDDALIVECSIV